MKSVEETARIAANRRSFLKGAGMSGLGLAGAAIIGSKFGESEQKVAAATDIDGEILNFALNLEYLEAEFYAMSTYGATLVELGVITKADETGPTTGGNKVPNFGSSPVAYVATGLRENEIDHVIYLRKALGYGFASVDSFLKLARQFEDVGVSAYLGAAPLITSSAYLAAAGAILATEAQHSGSIRLACIWDGVVSPAVDSLDIPPTSKNPYDVTSAAALSIPRTTSQVLNIVYAGGKCAGGFYPQGMNGSIVCQS
jgi:hypothetical protein